MIITFYFDLTVTKKNHFVKKMVQINTGINKPNPQNLYEAMDIVNSQLVSQYGVGVPFTISNTKTEYSLTTK